jgi:hypothetical protein
MKKHLLYLLIIISFTITSCETLKYNRVYIYKDEFRESERTYTTIRIKPEERRTEIGSARLVLEKELGQGWEDINAYFIIYRSSSSFEVDRSGFVKIGDHKYELSLQDPVSEFKSESEATISGIASVDSSGVVSGQTADVDTRTWIEDKFVVYLPQEVVSDAAEAEAVIFRFYFGPIPVTYKLGGKNLDSAQEVLKQQFSR